MNKKYSNLGIGIALCFLLAVLFFYGGNEGRSQDLQKENNIKKQTKVDFIDPTGKEKGQAILQESDNGVLITLSLHDLPEGQHAIHIHEAGNCTPLINSDENSTQTARKENLFEDAGGHLNPGKKEHGVLNNKGPHAGDLLNITVNQNGTIETALFSDLITLDESNKDMALLLDKDGSAFIIHEGTDDYISQPTGDAGNRIACGIISK